MFSCACAQTEVYIYRIIINPPLFSPIERGACVARKDIIMGDMLGGICTSEGVGVLLYCRWMPGVEFSPTTSIAIQVYKMVDILH